MNQCSTCKHWEKAGEYVVGHSFGYGICQAAPMFWEATQWNQNDHDRELKPKFASTKHFVQDGSDYSAALITAPDFGCVSHCAIDTITNQPGETK